MVVFSGAGGYVVRQQSTSSSRAPTARYHTSPACRADMSRREAQVRASRAPTARCHTSPACRAGYRRSHTSPGLKDRYITFPVNVTGLQPLRL